MGLPNLLYLLWDPSEKGEIKDLLLPMASKTPLNGLISCFFSPPWHLEISSQVSSLTTGLLEFHKSLPDHNHQTLQTLTCHFQPYLLSSEPDSCFWEAPNKPDVGLNCLWKDLETASSIHFFCVLKLTFLLVMQIKRIALALSRVRIWLAFWSGEDWRTEKEIQEKDKK